LFNELGKRRNVGIRYDRYANALTASAVYNVNRGSSDDPTVAAFDFVRDEKSAMKRERLREVKRHIRQTIGNLPITTSKEKYLDVRLKLIADLLTAGHNDAEELFDECWPHLKPTKEEETA
jgi:hypothetical protein